MRKGRAQLAHVGQGSFSPQTQDPCLSPIRRNCVNSRLNDAVGAHPAFAAGCIGAFQSRLTSQFVNERYVKSAVAKLSAARS
jgi:hypothetical protein